MTTTSQPGWAAGRSGERGLPKWDPVDHHMLLPEQLIRLAVGEEKGPWASTWELSGEELSCICRGRRRPLAGKGRDGDITALLKSLATLRPEPGASRAGAGHLEMPSTPQERFLSFDSFSAFWMSFPPGQVLLPDRSFSFVQVTGVSTRCSVLNIPLTAPSLLSPLSRSPIPVTAASSCHYCHPPPQRRARTPHHTSLQPPFPRSWAPLLPPRAPCPSLQPPCATSPSPAPGPLRPLCCACPAPDGPVKFTWCGKWPSAGQGAQHSGAEEKGGNLKLPEGRWTRGGTTAGQCGASGAQEDHTAAATSLSLLALEGVSDK